MENARIIKLDSPVTVTAVNFEEAFGEYSELIGARARQRRADRKLDRISKRREIQSARRAKRAERQQERIAMRTARRLGRQQARTAVAEERQQRRNLRAEARAQRRALRQQSSPEESPENEDPEMTDEVPTGVPTGSPDSEETGFGESTEEGGVEGGMQGVVDSMGSESNEGSIEPPEYGEEGDMPEEEPYEPFIGVDGYYDFFTGEGITDDAIDYESLGSVDDIYALQPDDFYTYTNGTPESNFDGTGSERFRINPKVKNAAMKSEWNKEMANRLTINLNKINEALSQGINSDQSKQLGIKAAKLSQSVILHKARASSFDAMLSNYAGFDGIVVVAPNEQFDDGTYDDSSTVGDDEIMSYANGKKRKKISAAKKRKIAKAIKAAKKRGISRKELGRRRAEVRAALTEARKSRIKNKGLVNKDKAKLLENLGSRLSSDSKKSIKSAPVTEVEQGLKPIIKKNKIVIPPQGLGEADLYNGADGTGIIAIDDASDYDAPTGISYETTSGADGSKGISLTGVVIGVGVAGLLIWAAKKYNWIK